MTALWIFSAILLVWLALGAGGYAFVVRGSLGRGDVGPLLTCAALGPIIWLAILVGFMHDCR